ncbi:MAG: diaminopimelate decarboxylase [Verrucomicrobia bacterium]|nr:diaminopimelate decarboxylase [Verrucomicrobiota bacterium]
MHSFHYRENKLFCEDTDLARVAETYGTPLYVYSRRTITDHYRRLDSALKELDHEICYAVKANSNVSLLHLLAEVGAGFDIVSGGELYRVLTAGGSASKCTFAGVGKTREEISYALHNDVLSFNVESEEELFTIDSVAKTLGKTAPIALRVNPDVDAATHKYISTGKSQNKFGIGLDRVELLYEQAAALSHVKIVGVQTHIGSQITESGPFVEALEKLVPLVKRLRDRYQIQFFSIGGGIGIVYRGSLESGNEQWWSDSTTKGGMTIEEYVFAVVPLLKGIGVRVLLEPGRFLVGNAGVLLCQVLYVKQTTAKRFVIVDAGMNDLIRPALYEGYHEVVPVARNPKQPIVTADVVGPVCESGDFFALDREISDCQAGDLVAIMSAGAYGFSMASNYNSRPLPAEVLVDGTEAHLIRRRQNYADLVEFEVEG